MEYLYSHLLRIVSDSEEELSREFDCPVCLQNASFPVELPCHHIFCFLCVKGVANRSRRCALCRQDIPADFFRDPKLLCKDEIKEKSLHMFDDGYQWFYEGRNGWWQYDERTSCELESKYKKGEKIFELLIAGFLYVIDLENMRQCRRNDQTRRRRIRRDLRNIPGVKGIAGLKYHDAHPFRPSGDGGESSHSPTGAGNGAASRNPNDANSGPSSVLFQSQPSDGIPNAGDDSYLTPPAPNNTPQTPMTPADSQPGSLYGSQEDLSSHFQDLHIHVNTNNLSSWTSPVYESRDSMPRFQHDSSDVNFNYQPVTRLHSTTESHVADSGYEQDAFIGYRSVQRTQSHPGSEVADSGYEQDAMYHHQPITRIYSNAESEVADSGVVDYLNSDSSYRADTEVSDDDEDSRVDRRPSLRSYKETML